MAVKVNFLWKELGRRPLVVASLGSAKNLLNPAAKAARDGADLIEVRADTLDTTARGTLRAQIEKIKQIVHCPIILTVRSRKEQQKNAGFFPLNDAERRKIFVELMDCADMVDMELRSARIFSGVLALARRKKKKVILSHHNFARFPSEPELSAIKREFNRLRADILKVAVPARTASELLKLMDLCIALAPLRRVVIGMGEWGKTFRIAGFRFGSLLTYGYVTKKMAPGQIPVQTLADYARRLAQKQ